MADDTRPSIGRLVLDVCLVVVAGAFLVVAMQALGGVGPVELTLVLGLQILALILVLTSWFRRRLRR